MSFVDALLQMQKRTSETDFVGASLQGALARFKPNATKR